MLLRLVKFLKEYSLRNSLFLPIYPYDVFPIRHISHPILSFPNSYFLLRYLNPDLKYKNNVYRFEMCYNL